MCQIDQLADSAIRRAVRKKIIWNAVAKDESAFEQTLAALKAAFTRAWLLGVQKAIGDAIDTVKIIGVDAATPATVNAVMTALEEQLGGQAMAAVMRGPLLNFTTAFVKQGLIDAGASAGVDIAFGLADLDALTVLKQANLFWVRQSWTDETDKILRELLTTFFQENNQLTVPQLGTALSKELAKWGSNRTGYWDMLADHTATKTREIGRVSGYLKAGIMKVRVKAYIDGSTTQFCRSIHGKVISIQRLVDQRDAYLEACKNKDTEAAKAAWVMHKNDDTYGGEEVLGIGSPPYHFRCRTITVAEFG